MTSAYSGMVGDGCDGLSTLSYIPFQTRLPSANTNNGLVAVEVAPFRREDWDQGMELMNLIIREGRTWPFVDEFETMDAYRSYFLSHTALCVRALDSGDFMGCFYIKPNFPGRCAHVCNGGFITTPRFRSQGVAKLMGHAFLQVAKDLGYKSSYFNLVFKSNIASVSLWESLGFERVAVLEKAADLKGVEGLDTAYGYRYDLEKLDEKYLWQIYQDNYEELRNSTDLTS